MAAYNFAQLDLIAHAQAKFDALANYEATICSMSSAGVSVEARYRYLKPGFIRMEFIHPHAGAVLAYSPQTDEATLWPFGFHRFPRLAFPPDHPLIQGPNGHRIDRSHLGALLTNVRELALHGNAEPLGAEVVGSRDAAHIAVAGAGGYTVGGVGRYELWFDTAMGLPIKIVSALARGETIESVVMDDLRVDLPDIEWL